MANRTKREITAASNHAYRALVTKEPVYAALPPEDPNAKKPEPQYRTLTDDELRGAIMAFEWLGGAEVLQFEAPPAGTSKEEESGGENANSGATAPAAAS